MQGERSVHDNLIYAYVVNCEQRELTLHTVYHDRDPAEFTDIVFREVVAHSFEHVLPGNIVFDVEEVEVPSIIEEHSELFQDSWKWGWPPIEYRGDLNVLAAKLKQQQTRAYLIGSSYGLSGWVFADSCERVARESKA